MLRNPDAPATLKQLSYLKTLTGEDYRDSDLTMQEASDKIAELEAPGGIIKSEIATAKRFEIPDGQIPFSEPDVTLITGKQRSGKTMTAVARIKDAYDRDCVRIYCKEVLGIDVDAKGYDRKRRTAKIKRNGKVRIIHIPSTYQLHSPLKIFCNFHLLGIPFVYCPSFRFIIEGLKTELITDGYLVMDELYIGTYNRDSMGFTSKSLAKLSNQYAKGMLRVIMIAPIASQLTWEQRLAPNEVIETSYDKNTKQVTCHIKKKGIRGTKVVPYDATKYMGNYWTNERITQ